MPCCPVRIFPGRFLSSERKSQSSPQRRKGNAEKITNGNVNLDRTRICLARAAVRITRIYWKQYRHSPNPSRAMRARNKLPVHPSFPLRFLCVFASLRLCGEEVEFLHSSLRRKQSFCAFVSMDRNFFAMSCDICASRNCAPRSPPIETAFAAVHSSTYSS